MAVAVFGTPVGYGKTGVTTSGAMNYTTSTAVGAIVICQAFWDGDATVVPATPAGWTAFALTVTQGTGTSQIVYWHLVGASDTSVTFTGMSAADDYGFILTTVTGSETTSISDVTPGSAHGTAAVTAVAPSITTVTAGDLLLACFTSKASGSVFSTPAGYTLALKRADGAPVSSGATFYQVAGAAGATGTVSTTITSSLWTAFNIAIKPLASTGTTYNNTVTATQTTAATLGSTTVNIKHSVTQAQSVTMAPKTITTIRTVTQAQVATHRKTASFMRAITQAQTATIGAIKVVVRTVTTTQGQTAVLRVTTNIVRAATQPTSVTRGSLTVTTKRTVTQPQVVTHGKYVNLTKLITQAQTATKVANKVAFRTVTAVVTTVLTLKQLVSSTVSIAQAQLAALAIHPHHQTNNTAPQFTSPDDSNSAPNLVYHNTIGSGTFGSGLIGGHLAPPPALTPAAPESTPSLVLIDP
jgi:hypothetical protein